MCGLDKWLKDENNDINDIIYYYCIKTDAHNPNPDPKRIIQVSVGFGFLLASHYIKKEKMLIFTIDSAIILLAKRIAFASMSLQSTKLNMAV